MIPWLSISNWKEGEPPPIQQRRICPNCNLPLRLMTVREGEDDRYRRRENGKLPPRGPIEKWKYNSYGHFCTLRCCEKYANTIYDLVLQGKFPYKK